MAKVLLVSVADFVSFSFDEYTITKMTLMSKAMKNMTLITTKKIAFDKDK